MSAAYPIASLDAPVTLKIFFDGATRRVKMPLREMVPRTLEKHVRTFLHIVEDSKIIVERFSDSAAAYVLLDPANVSVYKQLYRAAKAKSNLKLRVTVIGRDGEAAQEPAFVAGDSQSSKDSTESAPIAEMEMQTPAPTLRTEPTAIKVVVRSPDPGHTKETSGAYPAARHATVKSLSEDTQQTTGDLARSIACQLQHQPAPASHAAKHRKAVSVRDFPSSDAAKSNDNVSTKPATPSVAECVNSTVSNKAVSPQPAKGNDTVHPNDAALYCRSTGSGFAVCCNHCEKTMPNAHYHCSTCDDGDFDLCQLCVDQGITCYSNDHWLIKRTMKNGQLVNSITETIAPKPKPIVQDGEEPKQAAALNQDRTSLISDKAFSDRAAFDPINRWACLTNMRTCNCCVQEFPDRQFLHCKVCEDYDLCQACFANDGHGHHPKHGFVPAVPGSQMPDHIKAKMRPGRNQMHHAICDGCDKYITGVLHKCLDCPDWDYCSECVPKAHVVHPVHRFAPIYEPLANSQACPASQPIHVGICCDGPLCSVSQSYPSYVRGIRYKCAVCNDVDFCASCEAHPGNDHNKTHPLIKFKTPVRHVSVTTTGERQDGKRLPAMGDRMGAESPEATSPSDKNAINAVQTVVEMKPQESLAVEERKASVEDIGSKFAARQEDLPPTASDKSLGKEALRAVFVHDSVPDGAILQTNQVFEQTWVIRNEGCVAWPAGCSVKFVGGDYMGHVDSAHPAGISELVSASESTICYTSLAPGQEFSFTVLLRTPARPGRVISYWRLTTQDGFKFGHRLWCDVNVRPFSAEAKPEVNVVHVEDVAEERDDASGASSAMIFPKLEKEYPSASIHENVQVDTEVPAMASKVDVEEGFEDCGEDDEWDASEEGFMTDEEYDILDASDEEFLEQQQQKLGKQ